MQNFDYQAPTRLIFGKGVVAEKLQSVMAQFGIPMMLHEVGIDDSRIDEKAKHITDNEGLEHAWASLLEADIKAILIDCL